MTVARYVVRNARRAELVDRAEDCLKRHADFMADVATKSRDSHPRQSIPFKLEVATDTERGEVGQALFVATSGRCSFGARIKGLASSRLRRAHRWETARAWGSLFAAPADPKAVAAENPPKPPRLPQQ